MRSLLLSRRDLDFLLHDWLDVPALLQRDRFAEHTPDTVAAVLELSERIATEHFAPHNRAADANEPRFDGERVHLLPELESALGRLAESGMLAATADAEVGGLQLPQVVAQACFLWIQAANIASSAYAFLSTANANLLLAHGSKEQIATYVEPMLAGRFHGTMCLSEPQAGSSLADITSRAEPQPDGSYRLFGNKMWISGGDHEMGENIVHLVLAKLPDAPAGVKGISLFLVPRYLVTEDGSIGERNDVTLAGLNHKMGYRGTVNTLLNFGESTHTPGGAPGAVGYLVGEPHQGLAYMFHMMNEARIGVGSGAAALAYTGYLHALDYARTRTQGRPATAKDPASPPVPIIEHPDVRRMLLAQKSYAEGAVALVLYCARLLDETTTAATPEARQTAHLLLEVLTPIAKSWPSQWGTEANDLAIQVHGGYGYTRDYPVEQFYRDNRLNSIHEGTHGIQGLDLLGRKMRLPGAVDALRTVLEADLDRSVAAGGRTAEHASALRGAVTRLVEVTALLGDATDRAAALANSTMYLEATGHVVIAWIWLQQELALGARDDDFAAGKRAAGRYFFTYELPRATAQLELLARLDRTFLEVDPDVL